MTYGLIALSARLRHRPLKSHVLGQLAAMAVLAMMAGVELGTEGVGSLGLFQDLLSSWVSSCGVSVAMGERRALCNWK